MLVYVANATWHHLPPAWERMIKLAWSSLASSSHCILLLFSAGLFQEVCVSQTSSWVWLTRLGSHEGPVGGETGGEIRGWVGEGMYCGCRWLTITGLHGRGLEFSFLRRDNFWKNFQVLRNSVPTKVTKANLHLFDGVGFSANYILPWAGLISVDVAEL